MPVICYHLDGSGSGTTSTTAQNGGAASETKPQQTQSAAETKPQQSQAASNNPSGAHETTAAQNGRKFPVIRCGAADDCNSSANHRGTAGIPADHRSVSADQRGFLWFRSGAGLSGTETVPARALHPAVLHPVVREAEVHPAAFRTHPVVREAVPVVCPVPV